MQNKNTLAEVKKDSTELPTIFNDASVKQIEHASTVMREISESLDTLYWEKHTAISKNMYKNREQQHRDMVALGVLAKALSDMRRVTGDVYCLSISAGKE